MQYYRSMSYARALRSIRPLWLTAAVLLVAGCEALVGDLPDPMEPSGDGGNGSNGGSTGSGGGDGSGGSNGKGGSGGEGDGGSGGRGSGGASESGGGTSAGGAGGTHGDGGASSGGVGGGVPDGGDGGDAGGSGGFSGSGGESGGGGAASGGGGGTGDGGSGVTGGATGTGGGATGGATATGGTGTGGSVTCTNDADNDTFISKACGGPDCDDSDEFVRPNQTAYFDKASKGGTFDYNCNNSIELDPALNKKNNCGLLGSGCNRPEAYLVGTGPVPACGQSAPWGTCKDEVLGLSCSNAPRVSIAMACR